MHRIGRSAACSGQRWDAFGAPFEGASTGAIERELSLRAARPRPWRYTDDTITTLAVARALVNGHEIEIEPERLFAKLANSFDSTRGYGRGMRRCIEAYLGGTHWSACASTSWSGGSAGIGAAVRVSPISCRHWTDTRVLIEVAEQSNWLTHVHPDAITAPSCKRSPLRPACNGTRRRSRHLMSWQRSRATESMVGRTRSSYC